MNNNLKENIMKNKLRKEKGITLLALVVTIIIIIILSTITINTLFGDNGLIQQARQTKAQAETMVENDKSNMNSLLQKYANTMAEEVEIPEPTQDWHYDENGNITNGKVTLEIGDYVNYDCTTNDESYTSDELVNGYGDQTFTALDYSYGWRVLGVDERTSELLILSEDLVPLEGGYSTNNYYLRGSAGYEYGLEELDKICEIYGKGEGATGGRSITVDDVNRITGYNPKNTGVYDPEQTGEGTVYVAGDEFMAYGIELKYYWPGPYCRSLPAGNRSQLTSHSNGFTWYDQTAGWQLSEESSTSEEITTIENNYYLYYPNTLKQGSSGTTVGIDTDSQEYKMLFTNNYWIGSTYACFDNGERAVAFGIRIVSDGYVNR